MNINKQPNQKKKYFFSCHFIDFYAFEIELTIQNIRLQHFWIKQQQKKCEWNVSETVFLETIKWSINAVHLSIPLAFLAVFFFICYIRFTFYKTKFSFFLFFVSIARFLHQLLRKKKNKKMKNGVFALLPNALHRNYDKYLHYKQNLYKS